MARYHIDVSATAEKQLKKLPRAVQIRIVTKIMQLADDPYPSGCRKLTGFDDAFRVRVGTYRVIYSVHQATIVIVILKIGHRKDVYR